MVLYSNNTKIIEVQIKPTVKNAFNTSKHKYKFYIHGYETENSPKFKF